MKYKLPVSETTNHEYTINMDRVICLRRKGNVIKFEFETTFTSIDCATDSIAKNIYEELVKKWEKDKKSFFS